MKFQFFVTCVLLCLVRGDAWSLSKATQRSNPVATMREQRAKRMTIMSDAASKSGKATLPSSTFNLAKNIVGAGVLSLPNGIAYFSDAPSAIYPSTALLVLAGCISAYSFSLIGRACAQHKTTTFQDTWAKSVSPSTAKLINGGITLMCFMTVLAYSLIIGDSFTGLAKGLSLPALFAKREHVILIMTTFALLPLVSLQNLAALAPFSLLGLGGMIYTTIYMAIRYTDKSYAAGGKFFSSIAASAQPVFNTRPGSFFSKKAFMLLSMLSTAYIAHFNAPKFYAELDNPTINRYNKMVWGAFSLSMVFFTVIMALGYFTFGGNCLGLILNNYAASDIGATIARFMVGGAILTSYPFAFSALRDGLLDLQNVEGPRREKLVKPYTIGLLSMVTMLALVLKDVGFVVGLSGALFGPILLMAIPALMNIQNIKKKFGTDLFGKPTQGMGLTNRRALNFGSKLELVANYSMIPAGIILTCICVAISVLSEMGKM